MMQAPAGSLNKVEYRLARHYLQKLRAVAAAVRLGQASMAYGTELFDQDWEQIKQWQAWAAKRREDGEQSRLCVDYPLAGIEVLSIRTPLTDQARWLETGLEAAARLIDTKAEFTFLFSLSSVYFRLGHLDKSERLASALSSSAAEEGNQLYFGRGALSLGRIQEERGAYGAAQESYHLALEIFRAIGARTDEGITLGSLGAISLYSGRFEEALSYFQQQYELVKDKREVTEMINALQSIGQSFIMLEDYPKAEPYLQRSVRLSRIYGARRLLGAGLPVLLPQRALPHVPQRRARPSEHAPLARRSRLTPL
jgi:tetratricopeptide (TPR) repeat protein